MNLLDDEVFAVIMAFIIIGSMFGVVVILRQEYPNQFIAIGLLNEECKMGEYPEYVFNGDNLTLCILLANYLNHPVLLQIRYKIAVNTALPTNTTPSPEKTLETYRILLDRYENTTFRLEVPVKISSINTSSIYALVFELWMFDPAKEKWSYTGKWTHLHVNILESPLKS